MAGNLQQRLESIKAKAEIITQRYKKVEEQKRAAELQIAELQDTIRRQHKELQNAMLRIEQLQVVNTVVPKREDVEQTRVILSELVREIDKCINDLTQ